MELAFAAALLAPGLAIGSFLNVVAARLPLKRSLVHPGSACMSCGTAIAPRDNIPVLSYLLLRGRCRHCGVRISFRYPAVELSTALLAAGCVIAFGLTARAAVAAIFCACLVVVTATDLEHRIVPNRVVIPAGLVLLAAQTAIAPDPEWALSALGASGFLFAAALVNPRGMGMGDVKLAFLMGAVLGRTVGVALLLGLVLALIPSVVLLARHGQAARKRALPLAPFLAAGSLVALFAGSDILRLYLGLY